MKPIERLIKEYKLTDVIDEILLYIHGDINMIDEYGNSLIRTAASRNEFDIVQKMLEIKNIDVDGGWPNSIEVDGTTNWVHRKRKETPLHCAVKFEKYKILNKLIEKKANVDIMDEDGSTALHLAIKWCNVNMIKRLVEDGRCNVNLIDNNGRMPLDINCVRKVDNFHFEKYLRKHGAHKSKDASISSGKYCISFLFFVFVFVNNLFVFVFYTILF